MLQFLLAQSNIKCPIYSYHKMAEEKKNNLQQFITGQGHDLEQRWRRVIFKTHRKNKEDHQNLSTLPAVSACYLGSEGWPLKGGFDELEGRGPLSWEGVPPHFSSASEGSTTCTAPSLMPSAIWLGSDGWGAITKGWAVLLLQYISSMKLLMLPLLIWYNNTNGKS